MKENSNTYLIKGFWENNSLGNYSKMFMWVYEYQILFETH